MIKSCGRPARLHSLISRPTECFEHVTWLVEDSESRLRQYAREQGISSPCQHGDVLVINFGTTDSINPETIPIGAYKTSGSVLSAADITDPQTLHVYGSRRLMIDNDNDDVWAFSTLCEFARYSNKFLLSAVTLRQL